jgi:hypothetical protein
LELIVTSQGSRDRSVGKRLRLTRARPHLTNTTLFPQAHLRRGSEPVGGANSWAPHRVILNLLLDSYLSRSFSSARTRKKSFTEKCPAYRGPLGALLEIEERLPLSCMTSTAAPLRGSAGAGGPGAPTINTVKMSTVAPLGGGAKAGGPGVHTINARKHQ